MAKRKTPVWAALWGAALAAALAAGLAGATEAATLKFHPGHYIALDKGQGQEAIRDAARPGVVGVEKRYSWAELERDEDRYDFSQVDSDLTLAARLGLRFVMFVEDKSFTSTRPTPRYLEADTLPLADGGWIAKRWDPEVLERFSRLLKAIGARFDGHPYFEGIALQETSLGLAGGRDYGYTPEAYRDALIRLMGRAREALPSSQVFWYMNFLEGKNAYLADVAEAAVPHRIAMGGPDVMPDNPALLRHAYPLYRRFRDRLTLFCSIQNKEYALRRRSPDRHGARYWTLEELFEFARDELGVDYLFWNRKNWRKPPDSYDWTDALRVIGDHPAFGRR
jgi:hypothetical protein